MTAAKQAVTTTLVYVKPTAPRDQEVHALLARVPETLDVGLPSWVLVNLVEDYKRSYLSAPGPICIDESVWDAYEFAAPSKVIPAPSMKP